MDYKIVQTKKQKFIAIINEFSNEIINDNNNHDIPDFWGKCQENKTIDKLLSHRVKGKKDLFGLCSPSKEGESTFSYGIAVLLDDETIPFDETEMKEFNLKIWDVQPGTYVVFDCVGEDGDCISNTWASFYKEFLPQTGYKASEQTDYEIYYEESKDGLFCELWIPLTK